MALVEFEQLTLDFVADGRAVRALDGVSFKIEEGEAVCLVGESGSGKSVSALSIGRLLPSPPASYGGRLLLGGKDVLRMEKRDLRQVRGGVISYVFQEPSASLNPVLRVGAQIMEMLRLHRPEAASMQEVIRLLSLVGIPAPESRARDYPHQLSGGMQQRVMIAMAIAAHPRLLVADEPTTALDVTIQAQILDLLKDLKERLGMSILLITHNLGIVKDIADRALVMYAGQIVEEAPATTLLDAPKHPYTKALLQSVPQLGAGHDRLRAIGGNVPQLGAWPSGCRFHPRCFQRQPPCDKDVPQLLPATEHSLVRCPYWNLSSPDHAAS